MMGKGTFNTFIIRKHDSSFSYNIEEKKISELPPGELLIKVAYSNINYKDVMSCLGNPSITRRFPHTPGIDACGEVVNSLDSSFHKGDNVLIIAKPMGLNTSGGFAEYIRIPSSWAIKIDENINKEYLMAFGTAGLTSGLAVNSLIEGNEILPSKIIITGVTGGIGIISLLILKKLGIEVTALTRSKVFINKLQSLGVDEIITHEDFLDSTRQNLAIAKWDGAIDVAGGNILSSLIKSVKPGGTICVTGNVGSTSLNTNVLPFILRGITLKGINAEMHLKKEILALINKLSTEWMSNDISNIYSLITLDELPEYMDTYIQGERFGRVVVKIS